MVEVSVIREVHDVAVVTLVDGELELERSVELVSRIDDDEVC